MDAWRSRKTKDIEILDLQTHQVSVLPGSQGLFSPRWSPDGRFVVAVGSDSQKLVLFNFQTQKWTDWVTQTTDLGFPAWSHDGKYLYFDSTLSNDQSHRRVKVGETKSEEVVSLKGLRRFFGSVGSWSGLAPDDTPIFVRDVSTQGNLRPRRAGAVRGPVSRQLSAFREIPES